jgi:hypothetical protein
MIQKDFDELREKLFSHCKELTAKKGEDYTKGNPDVLNNFKTGGETFGLTPYKTLGLLLKKQIDAVYNYIKTGGQHESEPIFERITDSINYLTFLLALVEDEKDSSNK